MAALSNGGHVVLALIAQSGCGKIAGAVVFSRVQIERDTGTAGPIRATALAPVAIRPDRQGRGIGSSLIEAGIARLQAADEALCVVLGEPAYYRRFGFDARLAAGLTCAYSGPYLMARWLAAPVTAMPAGRLVYPEPFESLA